MKIENGNKVWAAIVSISIAIFGAAVATYVTVQEHSRQLLEIEQAVREMRIDIKEIIKEIH